MDGAAAMSMSEDEVLRMFARISNWEKWGADDERGTLNFITPQVRRRALAAVRSGTTCSCSRVIETTTMPAPNYNVQWSMIAGGDAAPAAGTGVARDFIGLAPHGTNHTHIDAFSHLFFDALMYNGRPAALVDGSGARANAVMSAQEGIVTRGVLLDIAALRGVEYVEPREPVRRAELEAAERAAGLPCAEGDAVLVRLGRYHRLRAKGPECERLGNSSCMPGLDPDCLPWLHERRVALLGSDAAHDVTPSPYRHARLPIHVGALVYMGLHLLDNAMLDELAAACEARASREFLFMLAPLKIRGGTCSPVNPIAVL